jgi:hypothetical protein
MYYILHGTYTICTMHYIALLRNVLRLLVTANVVPRAPIIVALMMEANCSSEMWVLTRVIRSNIPADGILHNHRSEKPQIILHLSAVLCSGDVMSPVRYEVGFYILKDGILHSVRRENLKSYTTLTVWTL